MVNNLGKVQQGSILGLLLFLVYINDHPKNLETVAKLSAGDTSLFSAVHDFLHSTEIMKNDLIKMSKLEYQWKMSFNPELTKSAQEVIFSRTSKKIDHSAIYFNDARVAYTNCQKHLGMYLDKKLNFLEHITKTLKTNAFGSDSRTKIFAYKTLPYYNI